MQWSRRPAARRPRALHEHPSGVLGSAVHAGVDPAHPAASGALPDGVHIQVDGGVGPDNVGRAARSRRRPARRRTSIFGQKDIAARTAASPRSPDARARARARRARAWNDASESGRRRRRRRVAARSSARAGTSGRAGRTPRPLRSRQPESGAGRDAVRDARAVRPPRRTPPCVDAILAAGIAKSSWGERRIRHAEGIDRLREAGVEVELADLWAARAQNEAWRTWMRGSGGRS